MRAWWERRDRAAAERRHREDQRLRRDAQERDLLFALHASLEELRRRAIDVVRTSPPPQEWENALASAARAALFHAEQLADAGIREAAIATARECQRVGNRLTSDAAVDTHLRRDREVEADRRSEQLIDASVEDTIKLITSRLRELDPGGRERATTGV